MSNRPERYFAVANDVNCGRGDRRPVEIHDAPPEWADAMPQSVEAVAESAV
jgi:hypothetical protein